MPTESPANILSLRVPEEAGGDRLDRFLAELPEVGSRSAAERLVESGSVRVDGSARPKSYRLEGGEDLEVELPPEKPNALEPEQVDFRVVYEDWHLLVVDKPAGLVVHPGAGHGSGTLVHGLVGVAAGGGEEDRPGIVHRLDRDTSGLLVVARTDEAHTRLQEMVRSRVLERHYVALVRGRPRSWRGTIDAPIGRDRDEPTRQSLDTDTPREAVTHFEVAELLGGHALLDVRLETGRTHQIRVHLAAVDLPVVGDPVYGIPDQALGRQFLHANRLVFDHPFTGERIDLESPLPPDLDAYLGRLRASG
jgi:23S rRNA pseudouridine1911/1915/1917 synthase